MSEAEKCTKVTEGQRSYIKANVSDRSVLPLLNRQTIEPKDFVSVILHKKHS